MKNGNLNLLREDFASHISHYKISQSPETAKSTSVEKRNNVHYQKRKQKSKNKFYSIISAKNEWESFVDSLEERVLIILDKDLNVIRANRTVELWGWGKVDEVRGIHILDLLKPAIENDSINDWLEEWSKPEIQINVEWELHNSNSDKVYRFSYYPNKDIESLYHTDESYAFMLITDITEQEVPDAQSVDVKNNVDPDQNIDETDYIRLSAYRLHQLADKLICSQEEERKRVSSELHDGVGQLLSSLKFHVELALIESSEDKHINYHEVLSGIHEKVCFSLSELRHISTGLRSSTVEQLGILMSLKCFATEYNEIYTDFNVHLKLDASEEDIPDKSKSAIYRIVQESMNNIAKHSDAKNIFITLTEYEHGILLRVRDDGCGFDISKLNEYGRAGVGLNSMEERAINSGGDFTLTTNSLSGTTIQVFWCCN